MKNVLIYTDYTPASIEVAGLVANSVTHRINVVFFHALEMPDSLMDVMMRRGAKEPGNLVTEELRLQCKKLKNKYKNIGNINFKVMYGNSVGAFENYAEANEIDFIVWPDGYRFLPALKDSVDPEKMFLKAGLPIMRNLVRAQAAPAERMHDIAQSLHFPREMQQ